MPARDPACRTAHQRLLQCRLGRLGAAAARQVPAQKLTAVAVDHQRQRRPPVTPPQIRHMSVAQRSLGALATDGSDWIQGRKPTGRLRTCQPLSWKTRCTVFLVSPSRCATVR